MQYNKLVRDKIPEIIKNQGQVPYTRILDEEEYLLALEQKLDEEVREYHKDKTIEELADILEVVYALAEGTGASREALLSCYESKHKKRGGFHDRTFLISKEG